MADANWSGGDYYGHLPPSKGLAVARMMGHITYMSDTSMSEKFGRRFEQTGKPTKFGPVFEVEKYLEYRGDNFVKRFDANSYIYITKAMDYFDLLGIKELGAYLQGPEGKGLGHRVQIRLVVSGLPISRNCKGVQVGWGERHLLRDQLDIRARRVSLERRRRDSSSETLFEFCPEQHLS